MSETVRLFEKSDTEAVAKLNMDVFRGLEYQPRMKLGLRAYVPEGSFVAERNGQIIGCIGLLKLGKEGWFEVRNLSTKSQDEIETAERLLSSALEYTESKDARQVKAFTPAVQPYVDIYKQAGFSPVRRTLRLRWDIPQTAHPLGHEKFEVRPLTSSLADEAANVWLAGLGPYWDWWIEEEGGVKEVADWVRGSVPKDQGWMGAFSKDGRLVGLSIFRVNAYAPGEARFNGVYTLPELRGQGVGTCLMDATLREAARLNQKEMRVYTMAYLDHLAPGAILYLKSGGRIESEYLQLQAKTER